MANRVAWPTKRVKIGGQWFVRKPIVKTSGFVRKIPLTRKVQMTADKRKVNFIPLAGLRELERKHAE